LMLRPTSQRNISPKRCNIAGNPRQPVTEVTHV
jgi:hypothetical protein